MDAASNDGSTSDEISARIEAVGFAFASLIQRLYRGEIYLKTKLRVYKSVVLATLLYGCQTWAPTKRDLNRLDAFDSQRLRQILKVKWFAEIRNTDIIEKCNALLVSTH